MEVKENHKRNTAIKSIRLKIPGILNTTELKEIEFFQNNVIRPVLKFQNDLIIDIFKNHLFKHHITIDYLNSIQLEELVSRTVKKDNHLKYLFIGAIVGMMTGDEMIIYFSNEKEFNKRIINMVIQRIHDQLLEKYSPNIIV